MLYMVKAPSEIYKRFLDMILTGFKYCRVQVQPSYMAVRSSAPSVTENRFIQLSKAHQKFNSFSCCKSEIFVHTEFARTFFSSVNREITASP